MYLSAKKRLYVLGKIFTHACDPKKPCFPSRMCAMCWESLYYLLLHVSDCTEVFPLFMDSKNYCQCSTNVISQKPSFVRCFAYAYCLLLPFTYGMCLLFAFSSFWLLTFAYCLDLKLFTPIESICFSALL